MNKKIETIIADSVVIAMLAGVPQRLAHKTAEYINGLERQTTQQVERFVLPQLIYAQQFNPAELPFNPKGFILEQDIQDGLDVYAYNARNDSLAAQTTTAHADTLNNQGTVDSVAGFYDLIIPTDIASTPDIEEGPKAGDELYFRIEKEDSKKYNLDAINGPVIHHPGQIERYDMRVGLPASVDEIIIKEFSLNQNFPNPFNPVTTISYSVGKETNVSLDVYNIAGQKVRTLVNEVKDVGNYNVRFDGSNLSNGVYFFRMKAGNYTDVKKMMLIK